MPHLRWSENAVRDLIRLHDFLSSKSRDAARRAIKAIREGAKLLSSNPQIGRPIDELPPEFREWIVEFGQGAYVLLYRYDAKAKEVVLLAVRHGREAGY
jgi:plasmid stabilization system protein ParE